MCSKAHLHMAWLDFSLHVMYDSSRGYFKHCVSRFDCFITTSLLSKLQISYVIREGSLSNIQSMKAQLSQQIQASVQSEQASRIKEHGRIYLQNSKGLDVYVYIYIYIYTLTWAFTASLIAPDKALFQSN